MTINIAANKREFEAIARKYIKRDGLEKVLAWLDGTDFYTAPASTQYHLSVEGGLCQHSLNVFHKMLELCNFYYDIDEADEATIYNGDNIDAPKAFTLENIALVSLFHDICKANCYTRDFRNVKINGRWEQVEYWKWDEQFVYGHGTKSVYILQQFMRLYIAEAQAIRYHMAGKEDALSEVVERGYAKVYDESPLAVLLHLSDMMCTFLVENEAGE